MKRIFGFLIIALCLAAGLVQGQTSRTNRIFRPCPGSTTPAYVEIQKDGDVNFAPCSGRSVLVNDAALAVSALPSQTSNSGKYLSTNGTAAAWSALPINIAVAASDETTALTTGTAKITFYAIRAFTLSQIFSGLSTQSTSGLVTADVKKNGVSIFSTTLSIDANEDTSLTAATPAAVTTSSFAQGDKITVDIAAAGTGAKGLKLYLIGIQ